MLRDFLKVRWVSVLVALLCLLVGGVVLAELVEGHDIEGRKRVIRLGADGALAPSASTLDIDQDNCVVIPSSSTAKALAAGQWLIMASGNAVHTKWGSAVETTTGGDKGMVIPSGGKLFLTVPVAGNLYYAGTAAAGEGCFIPTL